MLPRKSCLGLVGSVLCFPNGLVKFSWNAFEENIQITDEVL